MITCKHCGSENPADAPLCMNCGKELEGGPQPILCPMCGLPNRPGSETCQYCGASIPPEPVTDFPTAPDFSASLPSVPGTEDLEGPGESSAEQTLVAKSGKKPTEPFYGTKVERAEGFGEEEPPPDFRIGPEPEEEDDDVDKIDVEAVGLIERLADLGKQPDRDQETPDWLRQVSDPPPPQPSGEEAPDWLEDLTTDQPIPSPPSSPIGEEAPDWLRTLSADQPTPSPPSPPTGQEAPDWLRTLSADQPIPSPPSPPPTPPIALPEVDDGEGLDWLRTAATEQAGPSPIPEPPLAEAEEEEVPDWLREEQPAPSPAPGPPLAEAEEEEVPDWLREEQPAPSPAPEPPPAEAEEEEVPDWLRGIVGPSGAEALPSEEEEELPQWMRDTPLPGPAPEWLSEMAKPPTAQPPVEEEEQHEWLAALDQEEAPPSAEPLPAQLEGMALPEEDEEPEWLSALETSPGSPQPPAEPSPPAPPPVFDIEALGEDIEGDEDMPDWLRAMQPEGIDLLEGPPDEGPAPFTGSPLFDWMQAEAEEGEVPAAEQEEVDLGLADLPAWMRNLRPTEEGGMVAEIDPTAREGLFAGPLPAEMESLRAKKIAGGLEAGQEERVETSGPLSGLRGSLSAEPIFIEPSAPEMVRQVAISDEQKRHVAILEELLSAEPEGVSVSGARKLALPVDRWAVYLILLVAIVLPIVGGFNFFPAPLARTRAADEVRLAIEALPEDARVLVAFEYEPDASGELDASAEAILHHLMTRGATIYALSSKPTGPTIAQSALERVADEHDYTYKDDWVNLGYVSGGAQGISGLLLGTPLSAPSLLDRDFRGEAIGPGNARLTTMDLDMIVLLAARPEDARVWVEQVGQPGGIPMVAAVSTGGAPLVYPYWAQGRQLQGVMAGLIDATAYTADLQAGRLPDRLQANWNGLAVGSAAAAGAIAIGGILASVSAWRQRQGAS